MYYQFPTLPNISILENIIVAGFFKAKDYKTHGSSNCLNKFVDEFKSLEEKGLEIIVDGVPTIIHFVLGILIEDNLALNGIMDFVTSFSANYHYRKLFH